MSAPGGPLFWKAFEKRVIDILTEEHQEIKRLKHERDVLIFTCSRQNDVLTQALSDDENRINLCENCSGFFIDNDSEPAFICDCDSAVCNPCYDHGGTSECVRCNTAYCNECINQCHGCQKNYCINCIGIDALFWTEGNGKCKCKYHPYCSMECVPADQRDTLAHPYD